MKSDTIAAIASAMTNSGIGIVRISGIDAVEIVDKIYKSKNGKKNLKCVDSHTIHYGFIFDGDELIDEVIVLIMKAPNSYTAENTVEIDCHGGVMVMNRILGTVIKNGARPAEPGEFTKRAFLNGRIDLSKAEAVIDVINSKNEFALKNSIKQLSGSLYNNIKELREKIIFEIAFIESALDDPEHISLEGYGEKLLITVDNILTSIDRLLKSFENGKILKEGINTVIVGKPNAGKSSLLNLLVGEEKAIVTEIAGTTRDVIEESIKIRGIGINVVDTAGIRSTDDIVEKIGVDRAKLYADGADLIIYVVDSSVSLDASDMQIIEMIQDKKSIVLLNKSDLKSMVTKEKLSEIIHVPIIQASTTKNIGIQELENYLEKMFISNEILMNDEVFITNIRHKAAISDAYDSLKLVRQSILEQMPEDFYSIDLMNVYASLGNVIGEEIGEDLVNEIFSKFCMGK